MTSLNSSSKGLCFNKNMEKTRRDFLIMIIGLIKVPLLSSLLQINLIVPHEYQIFCILNGRFELKAQVKTEIFESNSSFRYFLIVAQLQ